MFYSILYVGFGLVWFFISHYLLSLPSSPILMDVLGGPTPAIITSPWPAVKGRLFVSLVTESSQHRLYSMFLF